LSARGLGENAVLWTRVTMKEKERIMKEIENGEYMNITDFVRQAVREKLKETDR